MSEQLSTKPYKGTKDWLPDDYQIEEYIFGVWKEVCERYGYKQYLTPLIEMADIYRAKSGEVKEELFTLRDRADRDLALRPEMTPSVTRLVASIYKEVPKPIRLFSIANFFRNEAPQKGRQREFWQLNLDIFGEDSPLADLEIMSISIEILLAFNAPKDSFKLLYNNRILIDEFFEEYIKSDVVNVDVARIMDKFSKVKEPKFIAMLTAAGLSSDEADKVVLFLKSNTENFEANFPELKDGEGYKQVKFIAEELTRQDYADYFEFNPSVIRGFEYYDGMIFEVFDLNEDNRRSMFGGGRYNGLAEIFGSESFPATGVAPGNVTTRLFLESWGLLPELKNEIIYCPLLSEKSVTEIMKICTQLRKKGFRIENDMDEKSISEALRYANKRKYEKVLLIGEDELKNKKVTLKNLDDGSQNTTSIDEFAL